MRVELWQPVYNTEGQPDQTGSRKLTLPLEKTADFPPIFLVENQ